MLIQSPQLLQAPEQVVNRTITQWSYFRCQHLRMYMKQSACVCMLEKGVFFLGGGGGGGGGGNDPK